MIYAMIGLVIGILAGVFAPGYIPKEFATIFSVALMAGLDTVFGGLRAGMEGVFDATIFRLRFLSVNIILAAFFCYAGSLLNIDFYMVAILVLGMRIFQNLAIIRRLYLKK
jgi:small basic protein